MENDTSTCSIRSSSVKVQKIFDQYMSQIAPLPNFANSSVALANSINKENSILMSNEQRSNYHTRIQTPDKTTQRSNSHVKVIQALQKKNQDQKFELDSLKEQLKNYYNQQNSIQELNSVYQNLQQQYLQLDKDHKDLLQSYEHQLNILRDEKDQQIQFINNQYQQQLEDVKQNMQLQCDRFKVAEGCRSDQEQLLTETLEELRKEKGLISKLKIDFRNQLEDSEHQFEKQLQMQQKLYAELKQQNTLILKEKQTQDNQMIELDNTYKQLVNQQKQEIVKFQKQYNDIKSFFEEQMIQVQNEVSNALTDLRKKNQSFEYQLQEQEQIIEDLEDLNKQLKQQLLFKDQELINLKDELQQLQIQHEHLKQMNDEIILQFNQQIQELSHKLEDEKIRFEDNQSEFNDEEKKEIFQAVHDEQTIVQQSSTYTPSQTTERDAEYKQLLQKIIEVEKEAFRLNTSYQNLFQQFSQYPSTQESDKQQIKSQMTDLMQQIRINNSKLYELKAKEFTYLS